jgi:hypothetical protein
MDEGDGHKYKWRIPQSVNPFYEEVVVFEGQMISQASLSGQIGFIALLSGSAG